MKDVAERGERRLACGCYYPASSVLPVLCAEARTLERRAIAERDLALHGGGNWDRAGAADAAYRHHFGAL